MDVDCTADRVFKMLQNTFKYSSSSLRISMFMLILMNEHFHKWNSKRKSIYVWKFIGFKLLVACRSNNKHKHTHRSSAHSEEKRQKKKTAKNTNACANIDTIENIFKTAKDLTLCNLSTATLCSIIFRVCSEHCAQCAYTRAAHTHTHIIIYVKVKQMNYIVYTQV